MLGPVAAFIAISTFSITSLAQETPSEELNRQLDQAAQQSDQQQDVLNDQLNQAEEQANEQEAEATEQIEESEAEVVPQERELERQLDQAEDATGAEGRAQTAPAFPSQEERRLRLGISIDEEARVTDGIAVGEIMTGSAAATAGLRPGDVIVSIDGHNLVTGDELDRFVRDYTVGDTADFVVLRDGQRYPLTVTFAETHFHPTADYQPRTDYPPADYRPRTDSRTGDAIDYAHHHHHYPHAGSHGWLGVMLQPSNPPYHMQGVGIVSVVHGGPADLVGIEPGDRVLSWNHESLTSPEHLLHLLSHTDPGDEVELHVLSDGLERSLTLQLAEARVVHVDPPVITWYDAGYWGPGYWRSGHWVPGHWHLAASVDAHHPSHAELLEQHQRLVEQQQQMANMLRQIQSDLATIQRELDVQPTSGTFRESRQY
jgi:C-terminal processing protease CtpA/Prc